MKYRVVFMERTNASGDPSENPTAYLIPELSDGIVRDAQFIERDEPPSLHSEETMEEDDDFLSVASEVWEYDIEDTRSDDFENAMKNSQMVIDYEIIDDSPDDEASG
jgi:hypothetical protein